MYDMVCPFEENILLEMMTEDAMEAETMNFECYDILLGLELN